MDTKLRGAFGESLAAKHYRQLGYSILAANYRTRMGEVDLVAEKDGLLVFIEVKTRGQNAIGAPREWVGAGKQKKLVATAQEFVAAKYKSEPPMRFDVVEVLLLQGAPPQVSCIENAFGV